ncbi:MAG TPA: hypothetical protein VJ783_22180 [Pirellulales bacterium]|nr:hypothetical protein [Pirellulales bacterium]
MRIVAPVLAVLLTVASVVRAADAIPPAERRLLDVAVSDYIKGNTQPALAYLSHLASHASDAKRAALDEYLREKKLPPLAKLLAESRLRAIHNQAIARLGRPNPRQILLELPELAGSLDAELHGASDHRLLKAALPDNATLVEYERLLDTTQGLRQSLAGAKQAAEHLAGLVKLIPKAERASLKSPQAELVERDYRADADTAEDLSRRVAAIDALLRVRRLNKAADALRGKGSPAERLAAAYSWQEDAQRLTEFFRTFKGAPQTPGAQELSELAAPGLAGRVNSTAELCRRLAGPLTEKARELYAALDWWKLGRYGEGPEMRGLAKPDDASVNGVSARALYMPDEPPVPTDPAAPKAADATAAAEPQATAPHYARRLFHWWAWENLQLAAGETDELGGLAGNKAHLFSPHTQQPDLWPHFHPVLTTVAPIATSGFGDDGSNAKILSRLVGYFEYEQTLAHFQRFLAAASPSELAAADELVQARDELAIYTNLARFVKPAPNKFVESPANVLVESSAIVADNYQRRGLQWLIALAWIEHQAALVGFTASPLPLTTGMPMPVNDGAFQELLVDSALVHHARWHQTYFSQGQAGVTSAVAKLQPPDVLAEGRRTVLAMELMEAAAQTATVDQRREWYGRLDDLGAFREQLFNRILRDQELLKIAEINVPRLLRDPP